ncbi:MAG: hypothetical protein HYW88_00565 [Candidatus Sungbacteria bacterium]|nr:hypothetical protein [Candidatus Sungbacteria bacterium]
MGIEKENIAHELTDGGITIKPFEFKDAEKHLAGDDEEQMKWFGGGKSTLESVHAWIKRNQESWGKMAMFLILPFGIIINLSER